MKISSAAIFLGSLPFANAFTIPVQQTPVFQSSTQLHSSNEESGDVNTRRESLQKLMSAVALPLLASSSPANAFDNKISNQYDDRPKRRGPQPKDLGVATRKDMVGEEYLGLKPCGPSPNCFCSTDDVEDDPDHSIPAWTYPKGKSQEEAFNELYDIIMAYKPGQGNIDGGGFKVVTNDPKKGYIYTQFESLKAGYIDDFEVAYIEGKGENAVQVRSSSRVGYLDFGVNSKRINYIADKLRAKGWDAKGVEYATHKGYYAENNVSP